MSRMDTALRISVSLLALFFTGFVQAELGGLYWGAQSSVVDETAKYGKTVDNTNPGNNTAVKDRIFRSSTSENSRITSAGALIGYRHSLRRYFVALQAEASYNFGTSNGILPSSGVSPGANLLGEAWSETWEVVSNTEFGGLAKIGRELSFLTLARLDVFLLTGLKKSGFELDVQYKDVCLSTNPCTPEQLSSGSASYDVEQQIVVFGAGIERAITGSSSISLEFRMESDLDAVWTVRDADDAVTTTPELESERMRITASFNKYF